MAKPTSPLNSPSRPKLKAPSAKLQEELQEIQDQANADYLKKDEEIKASYDAVDAAKAEMAENDQLTLEELAEDTAKLEAEYEKKVAENKELDERAAEAENLAEVMKETQAANSEFNTQAPKPLFKEQEVVSRAEREMMNLAPDRYKNISPEFVASIQHQVRDNVLTNESQKAFRSESQKLLQEIDAKTVDARNESFASERPEGSSQILTTGAVDLLRKGDAVSVTSLISQMQQRGNRLIYAHENRIKDLQDRADLFRNDGDQEKAAYYDKKIEHELAAYERDTALSYLAQREFIDADRGETDALKEQRQLVEELREKADKLYAEVEKMEEFENAKEVGRDISVEEQEAFEKETEELDQDFENDFDDLQHELSEERDREQDVSTDDDPIAAEAAAEEAEAKRLKAIQEDAEADIHEDEDPTDQAIRKHEEETERHNEEVERERISANANSESDSETEVEAEKFAAQDVDMDIYEIPDEDTRTAEELEPQVEEEFDNPSYDMKTGKVVLEQEEETPETEAEKNDLEIEQVKAEQASDYEIEDEVDYVQQDYPVEIDEDQPVFDDEVIEVVDMDEAERAPSINDQGDYVIEEIEPVSDQEAQTSEADAEIDQLVVERQADVQDVDVAKQEKEIETVALNDDQKETEAEAEADAEVETAKDEDKAIPQEEQVDGSSQERMRGDQEQDKVSAVSEIKIENASDKEFRNSFENRMLVAENQLAEAEASGDCDKIFEAQNNQRNINQEFNSYMNDRQTLSENKAEMKDHAEDFLNAKNPSEREQAKQDYVQTVNDAAIDVNRSSDKPWGQSMARELADEYKGQMTSMKQSDPEAAKELGQAVKDSRDPDKSATVRVTQADVDRAQQAQKQAQTQSQSEGESQSQSAAA